MMPARDPELDAMVGEMKRANRKPLFVALGVIVALVVGFGLYVLSGRLAVAKELRERGYTNAKLAMNGPFTWGFTGDKGTAHCGGSYKRVPFSTSIEESCFDTKGPELAVPTRARNEVLADGIRAQFASLGIAGVSCPPVAADATTATCSVSGQAGAPIDVIVAKSDGDWKIARPERVLQRVTFAESLAKDLEDKSKRQVAVDCGEGLFGYAQGDTLTCLATRKGAKKPGSMVVSFGAEGGYTWTAKGI